MLAHRCTQNIGVITEEQPTTGDTGLDLCDFLGSCEHVLYVADERSYRTRVEDLNCLETEPAIQVGTEKA